MAATTELGIDILDSTKIVNLPINQWHTKIEVRLLLLIIVLEPYSYDNNQYHQFCIEPQVYHDRRKCICWPCKKCREKGMIFDPFRPMSCPPTKVTEGNLLAATNAILKQGGPIPTCSTRPSNTGNTSGRKFFGQKALSTNVYPTPETHLISSGLPVNSWLTTEEAKRRMQKENSSR